MNERFAKEPIIAQGLQDLEHVLDQLLEKREHEPDFANEEIFILYKLGNQQSLIKIDMQEKPFQFWYCDLMGRPATKSLKETIYNFLWEKCGGKDQYLQELAEGEYRE